MNSAATAPMPGKAGTITTSCRNIRAIDNAAVAGGCGDRQGPPPLLGTGRSRCRATEATGARLRSVSRVNGHRTLLLLRHAKSDYPAGVADHDRPLAPRGIREAGLAGDWLRTNAPAIDSVLCSTAARARQTLARTGIDAPTRYSERLYDAVPGAVIEEINTVGDEVKTLLIVGHEPTMSGVALALAGADATDDTVAERVAAKFPTSGIAVLAVPCAWENLEPGRAALVGFEVPR